jgi:hypothetical protein
MRPTIIREPVEVEIVRYETVPVPEALLAPCLITPLALETNADLEAALAEALIELNRCTADKDAIRSL